MGIGARMHDNLEVALHYLARVASRRKFRLSFPACRRAGPGAPPGFQSGVPRDIFRRRRAKSSRVRMAGSSSTTKTFGREGVGEDIGVPLGRNRPGMGTAPDGSRSSAAPPSRGRGCAGLVYALRPQPSPRPTNTTASRP
jgi:hypothetical protein